MKKDSHKNNQTTIFMVCDQNYDFVLANMIIGLKRYNEKLIDKIYVMYDGIPNETLEKIQSIWYGKIIFQRYTDEDFNKDIDNNEFIKDHEFTKKYKKFTYAKWYIFNILEKANTDTVVFLDVDMLVVDTLEELINQNVDFLAAYPGKRKGSLGYFESIEKIGLEEKMLYRSGGLYCYNKSIFDKTPTKLTKKCFEILVSYYGKNKLTANYDELIFGIVNTLYNFSFKDSRSFGYNCVFGYDNLENIEPKILHAVAHTKFWKHPASFYIFNEWYGNHKIWVKVYGGEDKISIPPLPIKKLNSVAGLWRFLDTFNHTLNCIEYINSKNISYKLSFSCYNVVINLSNIDIFINYKEPWSRPFVLIRNKFISKEINKIALKYNFIVKKQSIEKIYPLHEFAIFINEFKEIITQFQEKNIIKNKTIEKISLFSKEDKNFKAQNLNLAVAR
ncbi:TPA: hypothetical protein RZK38_001590, partial [Campylobacter coli]|nr:hypothetical protein [Campylobacter coli]